MVNIMCVVDGERKRWRESVRSRVGGGGGGGGRVRRKDRLGEKSRRWSEGKYIACTIYCVSVHLYMHLCHCIRCGSSGHCMDQIKRQNTLRKEVHSLQKKQRYSTEQLHLLRKV